MKRLLIALSLLILVLAVSCVSTDRTLLIVPEEGLQTEFKTSGPIGAKSDDGLQMIAGADYFDGDNATFMVSLASINGSNFTFTDNSIALYGGNAQTGKWNMVGKWDSNMYMQSEKAKANAAIIATGVIGAASTVSSGVGAYQGYKAGMSQADLTETEKFMAIMQQRLDEAEEELQAILEQIQSLVGQIAQLLSSETDTVNEIAMQMGQMA